MVQRLKTKISEKEQVSPKVYRITFKLEQPERISFIPGQFMNVIIDQRTRRSYSISSLPDNSDQLTTYVDISPGGLGSKFFMDCQVGDEVLMLAPLGRFVFHGPQDLTINDSLSANEAPAVFLATGTGIVPYLPILTTELRKLGNKRPFYLYQGFRYREDIFAEEELAALAAAHENFNYHICLSRPQDNWTGKSGYVQANLLSSWEGIARISEADYYLCGGAEMIEATRTILLEKGVSEGQIFYEKFY